ncbi:MAG TPA: DUF6569 family protein [Roseiflexaceae bacterium]|nr:DUF6569 family protein [Roseiflexaceae bacterium]
MTMIDLRPLAAPTLNLEGYRLGQPQRAGALTVVPVFGPEHPGTVVAPRSGLKLGRVITYGRVELKNPAPEGLAIVPLHIGYIQDGAQNHALCRSGFIGAGQTLVFEDACCVQQAQGGYLEGRDQWFFILPLELRAKALELRGQSNFSKLWNDIAAINSRYGLAQRGHLEQILTRQRAALTQFQSRIELLTGQIGAVFFLGERFAGLEIAPNAAYFAELWMPLVCFGYGVAAWFGPQPQPATAPFEATSLAELRGALERHREAQLEQVRSWLAQAPVEPLALQEEDRYLDMRLSTVSGPHLSGQVVTEHERVVYASLFASV